MWGQVTFSTTPDLTHIEVQLHHRAKTLKLAYNCLIHADQNRTALYGLDEDPKICRQHFDPKIFFNRIPAFSMPLPDLGKYELDWAPVFKPKGSGVCLERVVAFYNGPTEKCCHGWMMSKPIFPRETNNVSPIKLDLCNPCILDKCQKASRRVRVHFEGFYKK